MASGNFLRQMSETMALSCAHKTCPCIGIECLDAEGSIYISKNTFLESEGCFVISFLMNDTRGMQRNGIIGGGIVLC